LSTDVVTTVLAPAATYNLTDLATVRIELSIKATDTSNDAWLAGAIARMSQAVMTYTNRVFAPETVQDVIDIRRWRSRVPLDATALQLSRWPILAVTSVIQTLEDGATTLVLVAGTDFRIDAKNGRLIRLDSTTGREKIWEPFLVVAIYSAGFGAAVTETHTVPATPYKVVVAGSAIFSCDQLVTYANGTALTPVAANPAQGQYTVAAGTYTFAAADLGQALTFNYCTAALPGDVVDAVIELMTTRFRAKGRDGNLIQRDQPNLGTERYWFGSAPGQKGPFPPDIAATLDYYHSPVVG